MVAAPTYVQATDTTDSVPAIYTAFHMGLVDVVSLLLHHGAELDSSTRNPTSYLGYRPLRFFKWKVNLLRSIGFSDWNPLDGSSNLLLGAIHTNDLEELFFGLEIVKMDPTMQVTGGRALVAAATFNNVCFAGILSAAGAPFRWNAAEDVYLCPLARGLRQNSSYEMGHWLLFSGADTRQLDIYSGTAWCSFWQGAAIRYGNVPIHFIQMEGILSHLLLHGSNPHDIFTSSNLPKTFASANYGKPWYHHFGQIKATEVARLPAYKSSVLGEWTEYGHGFPSNDWKEAYEKNEAQRRPAFLASWTSSGVISWSDAESDDERESDELNFENGAARPVEVGSSEDRNGNRVDQLNNVSTDDHESSDEDISSEDAVHIHDNSDDWILHDFIWHPTPASAMANIGSTSSCRSSEGYVPLLGGVSDSRHQDIIRKPV
ncbi:ankyrin unc44 [Ilyonectria robusta]